MKKIFITGLTLLLIGISALAQVDRTRVPLPGPAPRINIGEPDTFTLSNGLRVYVVENHQMPEVTASLLLKIDPFMEMDKIGYSDMAGDMLRRGTTTMTKAQLDEQIDLLGGFVNTDSKGASAFSLSRNFEKTFSLMADVIIHPSFPADEMDKLKKQYFASLAQEKDDPSSILNNVSSVLLFGKDHPYGEIETGQTLTKITLDDLRKYYQDYWKPNIGYLVLVGDITKEQARRMVEKYLGGWQRGDVPVHHYPAPSQPQTTTIAMVDRPASVQTSIRIANTIELKPGDMENFPAVLMDNILGGGSTSRLFQDLREKHGYTYGAYSSLDNDPLVGEFSAGADVRNQVTDSAIIRLMADLAWIRDTTISDQELSQFKDAVSGNFARSLEDPSRIAEFARNIAYYHMPSDYYHNYLKSLAAVTPAQIREAALKFVHPDHGYIILVGSASQIAHHITQFGPIKYYDIYGNVVGPPQDPK